MNQFTNSSLHHHVSSRSSLLYLTMAKKTSFDSGLKLGWSPHCRGFLQVGSECGVLARHTLTHCQPHQPQRFPERCTQSLLLARNQFVSRLWFIAGLLLYPVSRQNK